MPESQRKNRFTGKTVHDPEHSAPEMGIVANGSMAPPRHDIRVYQVKNPKDKSRNTDGNKEKINPARRREENTGKNNRRNRTGSAHGIVIRIVPVFIKRRNHGQNNSAKIHEQEQPRSTRMEFVTKHLFHYIPKRPQHDHIDEKMNRVGMQDPVGQEPPGLTLVFYSPGIELPAVEQTTVSESNHAEQGCNYHQPKGDRIKRHHWILLS